MQPWVYLSGVVLGALIVMVTSAVGFLFRRKEQRRRDAADVAKMIYEQTKEWPLDKAAIREIDEMVRKYGVIFRQIGKEWEKNKHKQRISLPVYFWLAVISTGLLFLILEYIVK